MQSVAGKNAESGAKVAQTCMPTTSAAVKKTHAAINLPKTLQATFWDAKSRLQNLYKFCVYGVQTSFNFLDTATDKNPNLLKHQQTMDPLVQTITVKSRAGARLG